MIYLPHCLSVLRGAASLLFFFRSPSYRITAIGIAMITDFLDGRLARLYGIQEGVGRWLDPVMDKIFTASAFTILLYEKELSFPVWLSLFARDWALLAFIVYAGARGSLRSFRVRSVRSGKIVTTLQLLFLLSIAAGTTPPIFATCIVFLLLGGWFFAELVQAELVQAELVQAESKKSPL